MNDRFSDYQTLFGVRAAQVLGGFVGQIVIADEVIWQTAPLADAKEAYGGASTQLKVRLKGLFA